MFGKILSSVFKAVTVPVDIVNIGLDMATGGDGSKTSRTDDANPFGEIERLRDNVADTVESIDD